MFKYKFDEKLADSIKKIFDEHNQIYGYPRIRIVLKRNYNYIVSNKLVYKYVLLLGIKSKIRSKRNKKPKEIKVKNRMIPNIVNRKWDAYNKGELFVTYVTYLPYGQIKFAYLSVMKDVKTGFIVGYDISMRNDNKIYVNTLNIAKKYMTKNKNLIIHSDNGFQYTSNYSKNFCLENNIRISLNNPGNSLDNAACETFFASLKTEWFLKKQPNFKSVYNNIIDYLHYYNFNRIMIKNELTPWEAWNSF